MSEEGISGVLETYIVDTMEEIVRGDYNYSYSIP